MKTHTYCRRAVVSRQTSLFAASMSDPPFWLRKLTAIKSRLFPGGDANLTRLRRRQALIAAMGRRLPFFRCVITDYRKRTTPISNVRILLFVAGYLWMLAIPALPGRGTYIDENALLPGQVHISFYKGAVATHSHNSRSTRIGIGPKFMQLIATWIT